MLPLQGHIQPYLNAIVNLYNAGENRKYLAIPNVVRVQTGENVNVALNDEVEVVDEKGNRMDVDEDSCCSDAELEEMLRETSGSANIDYLEEGAGVAWDFGGNGMNRGKILQKNDNGTFVLNFVNGKCYKFKSHKMKKAR